MATHSSVLAWRIPEMGKPCGLPSIGSHRVRHDWSNLAAAAASSREFQKNTISALLTMPKPLTVWIIINCRKFLKRWEYQITKSDHLLRNLYAGQEATVGTGHGKTDWLQIGKEYIKAVYCHPAHLTYMQSTSWEKLGWVKHKLESRLLGEISITSDMQMTPSLWQKVKKN